MASDFVKEFTDQNFEQEVLKSPVPVLVDFWAEWCGPCRMIAPTLDAIAEEFAGRVKVGKVDVDANPMISGAFGIQSIPTIAFFKPGEQPRGVLGFMPLAQLEEAFGLAGLVEAA